MRLAAAFLAAAAAALLMPAAAAATEGCVNGVCSYTLTPDQLLDRAAMLVSEQRFAEAEPLISALAQLPAYAVQTRFLTGYIAMQSGQLDRAVGEFRAILDIDPTQTRARLELAGIYLKQGKTARADHHFKLAQADQTLPPDIARVIRSARNIIRSKRTWTFNVDVGIAPDTNINNATDANGVTLHFGDTPLDFTLDDAARARSGTGLTGLIQAGLRLPIAKNTTLLADLDLNGTNYEGGQFDDYAVQAALGPELRLSEKVSVSAQPLVAQRWYGGRVASRQAGGRIALQATLNDTNRIGVQIDARRTNALFDDSYDGWQVGAYGSYERVIARNAIASASLFVRRDWLKASAVSNTEIGGVVGVGAELPWGFNAGANVGASRANYDSAVALFGPDPRADWRLTGRLTLGNRKVQLLGFSPSITLSANQTDSNIDYYSNDRVRIRFGIARYF